MALNEIGMGMGVSVLWVEGAMVGPPHSRTYTWTAKMGDHSATAVANNKKQAKNQAAYDLLAKLPEEHKAILVHGKPKKGKKRKGSQRGQQQTMGWGSYDSGFGSFLAPGEQQEQPEAKKKATGTATATAISELIHHTHRHPPRHHHPRIPQEYPIDSCSLLPRTHALWTC